MTKKLKVPYLPALDIHDASSTAFLLETKGQREYIDTVNWPEYSYKPIVAFDIARTATSLFIYYYVRGNSLKAVHSKDGSPVYTDSCVEFFMQIPGEPHYRNFEFNCIGTCDASVRISREEKTSFDSKQYKMIRRFSSIEHKPFDEKPGLHEWQLIVEIPFSLMGLDPQNLPEMIKGNFYKCADETQFPHFLSWSPIDLPQPDFHCPKFFGEIYL